MNTASSPTEHAKRVHLNFAPGSHGVRVAGIYGTHAQLQELASGLGKALEVKDGAEEVTQPKQVFSIPATGLSKMSPNAVLAFYVASHDTSKPKPWSGPMFGSWWAFGLSLVGAIAIVKWVWGIIF